MKLIHTTTMKHTFTSRILLPVFALAALLMLSTSAFAGEPIPGVNVGAGKNPGGIITMTKTGKDGKFAFPTSDSGSYTITFPNDSARMPFNVQFGKGFKVFVNGKEVPTSMYRTLPVRPGDTIILTAQSRTITISGTITKIDTPNKR